MDVTAFKAQTDLDITSKVAPNTIDPEDVGGRINALADLTKAAVEAIPDSTTKLPIAAFSLPGYYNTLGVYVAADSWRSAYTDITGATNIDYSVYGGNGANVYSFYNSSGVYISGLAFSGTSNTLKSGNVIVPAGAKFFSVSTLTARLLESSASQTLTAPVAIKNIQDSLVTKATAGYVAGDTAKTLKQVESLIPLTTLSGNTSFPNNGFYTPAGVYNGSTNWKTIILSVTAGQIIYRVYSANGAAIVTFFNSLNERISSVNAPNVGTFEGSVLVPDGTVKAAISTTLAGVGDSNYSYSSKTETLIKGLQASLDSKQTKQVTGFITVSKTLVANGTTIFNTIAAALVMWVLGIRIDIFEGVYNEISLAIPDGCYLRGIGFVEIRGYLPPTSINADIETKSTLDWPNSGTLENLTITAKNMRYPIHSDFGAPNAIQYLINCRVIHYGNREAYDYKTLNAIAAPNNAATLWVAQSAWGCGSQAGAKLYLIRCYLESIMRAFSTHNNTNYNLTAGASLVQLDDCEIVSRGQNLDGTFQLFQPAFFVQSLSSNTPDRIISNNTKTNGQLTLQSSSSDYREFTQEVFISGGGTNLMQVRNSAGGGLSFSNQIVTRSTRAFILKLSAPNTSEVSISGNLAAIIFGAYSSLKGSVGLNSYAKSVVSIVDVLTNVNAYAQTKSITFTAGASTVTITLASNYATTAAMVTDINTLLGASGWSVVSYWTGLDWFPRVPSELTTLRNTGTTAILRGRAVKLNGFNKIAPMTSADAANLFYGVAQEDIPVDAFGCVKYKGYILRIWIDGLFGTTLTDGDNIKVNADGTFSKSTGTAGDVIVSKCIALENISVNI